MDHYGSTRALVMEVQVFMDYVIVLGQRIDRPARISRGSWLNTWRGINGDNS